MQFRVVSVLLAFTAVARAGNPGLEQQFEQTVRPFVTKYCVGCHSGTMPAAQFDLKSYTSVEMVAEDFPAGRFDGETDGKGNAAQADAAAAGRSAASR